MSSSPSFQDFEDFQYLQNYEDFTYHDDDDLSNLANDINVINAFFDSPRSSGASSYKEDDFNIFNTPKTTTTTTTENTESREGDMIFKALALADARKCDECQYPFSEQNSPEVYSGCGHMVCKSCYLWCFDLNQGRCSQCPPNPTQNLTRSHVSDVHIAKITPVTMETQIPSKKKTAEAVEISRNNEVGKKFEKLVVMRESNKPKWNEIIGRVHQSNGYDYDPTLAGNQNQWEHVACSGFLQPCAPQAISVILNPSDQLQYRQGLVLNTNPTLVQQNQVPFLFPVQPNQAFYPIPQQNQAPTSTIHHVMSASQIPTSGVSSDQVNFVFRNGVQSFPIQNGNFLSNNFQMYNQNGISNPMMMIPPQNIIPPVSDMTYCNRNSTKTMTYDLQSLQNNDKPVSNRKISNNGSNNRRRRQPSSKNSTPGNYRKICIKEEPSLPNPTVTRTFDAPENIVFSFPNPVEFIMNKKEPVEPGSPEKRLYRYSITADSIVVKVDQSTPTSEALDFLKDVKIKPCNQPQNEIDELKRQQKLHHHLQRKAKKLRMEGENESVTTVMIGTEGQIRRAMKRPSSPNSTPPSGLQVSNPQQIEPQRQGRRSVIVLPKLSNQQISNLVDNGSSSYS